MSDSNLYAYNVANLHIIIGPDGEECMKNVNIYAPNNGNVYIQSGDGKKGIIGIKIYGGTNTGDIVIDYTASNVYGEEMKDIEIYASSAQTLQINMASNGYEIEDAIIECPIYPIHSQYNGELMSSCLINASNSGILTNVEIRAADGFPKGVYLVPGYINEDSWINCTARVDDLNGSEEGNNSIETLDASQPCYWTGTPTSSPTASPTYAPSELPSKLPNRAPSKPPSKSPTGNPSQSPSWFTSAPLGTPSSSPIIVPTLSPNNNPTNNPSVSPGNGPSNSPSLMPSLIPSMSPSKHPTNSPSLGPSKSPSLRPTLPSINPSSFPSGLI